MPYTISTFTLPGGSLALHADAAGDIGKEDVAYFLEKAGPGSPTVGLPVLITTRNLKSLSSEARGFMTTSVDASKGLAWCAMVLTNPVIRVAVNFMMRLNRHPKLKIFAKEEDATGWLDERALEDAAKQGE
jgi:hypothetical protein